MLRHFRPTWSYWVLVGLLAVFVSLATSPAPISAAGTSSWLGYKNYVINFGSYALIDRPAGNPQPGSSDQLLISYVVIGTGQWFVQSGFSNKLSYSTCPNVNNDFYAFTEYIGQYTNGYQGVCSVAATQNGQSSVYNQTNTNQTPYWCGGINNTPCMQYVYEYTLDMTNATYVAAYGETTAPTAIMGNKSPNWAYIRKVSYSATRGGQINNPITKASTTIYSGVCANDSTGQCPYRYEGFDEPFSGSYFLTVRTQTK